MLRNYEAANILKKGEHFLEKERTRLDTEWGSLHWEAQHDQ